MATTHRASVVCSRKRISSFCFCQGFAYEEYQPLFSVSVFFEQTVVAIPEPSPTWLADLDRNPGEARPKPLIKSIYSYKRFRSQIFAEAVSI